MKFFTSDGCSYEGMSKEDIQRVRQEIGLNTNFVEEEEYKQAVTACLIEKAAQFALIMANAPPSLEDRIIALEDKVEKLLNGK